MATASEEDIEEYADRLRELFGDRLDRIVLYGSYAREEAVPGSDIDILIIVDEKKDGDRKTAFEAARDFVVDGKLFSPRVVTTDEYRERMEGDDPFIAAVDEEAVEV